MMTILSTNTAEKPTGSSAQKINLKQADVSPRDNAAVLRVVSTSVPSHELNNIATPARTNKQYRSLHRTNNEVVQQQYENSNTSTHQNISTIAKFEMRPSYDQINDNSKSASDIVYDKTKYHGLVSNIFKRGQPDRNADKSLDYHVSRQHMRSNGLGDRAATPDNKQLLQFQNSNDNGKYEPTIIINHIKAQLNVEHKYKTVLNINQFISSIGPDGIPTANVYQTSINEPISRVLLRSTPPPPLHPISYTANKNAYPLVQLKVQSDSIQHSQNYHFQRSDAIDDEVMHV